MRSAPAPGAVNRCARSVCGRSGMFRAETSPERMKISAIARCTATEVARL